MNPQVVITDFQSHYQAGFDLLLNEIQNEYPETIYGSGTKKLIDVYNLPGRKYWVATASAAVIGSIGIVILVDEKACIKSMFLQKNYRGSNDRIADKLLMTAIDYATSQGIKQLILGTMIQFKAAQAFYIKHGFIRIQENELPADFTKNPVDKVFYRLAF